MLQWQNGAKEENHSTHFSITVFCLHTWKLKFGGFVTGTKIQTNLNGLQVTSVFSVTMPKIQNPNLHAMDVSYNVFWVEWTKF